MKNKLIYGFLSLVVLFSMSCEEDYYEEDFPRDITTGWVEFQQTSLLVFNDIETLSVNVNYEVPVVKSDVTVDYTITGVAGTLGVNEGTFQSTVLKNTRDLVFDIPIDGNVSSPYQFSIVVTATSEDSSKVSVDLDGANNELIVTVIPKNWTGSTFLVSSAEVLNDDAFFENEDNVRNSFDVELVPEEDENLYSASTLWGDFVAAVTGNPNFVGQFPYPGEIQFNNDSTITVTGTSEDNADLLPGAVDEAFGVETINSINYADGTITYHLGQTLFGGGPFIVKVILAPAN